MRRISVLGLTVALFATACDDRFGPGDWTAFPDTVVLYSLNRDEHLGRPSALDLVNNRRVQVEHVESTRSWDVAVVEQAGEFMLAPAGVFEAGSHAGVAEMPPGTSFEELAEAPRDTAAYNRTEPVPIRMDRVYVIRSRRAPGFFGTCVFHAKIQPVDADAVIGTLQFVQIRNPNCNDRALVPPGD